MTPLTEAVALEIARALIKHGPEIAIAVAEMFKTGATIEQAIEALRAAKIKTAQEYRADAQAETV